MGFESYGLGSPREDIEDDIPAGWYGLKCIGSKPLRSASCSDAMIFLMANGWLKDLFIDMDPIAPIPIAPIAPIAVMAL